MANTPRTIEIKTAGSKNTTTLTIDGVVHPALRVSSSVKTDARGERVVNVVIWTHAT